MGKLKHFFIIDEKQREVLEKDQSGRDFVPCVHS